MPRSTRQPFHAGSWYDAEGVPLAASLAQWLQSVAQPATLGAQAVISPHAGYRYCGEVMAYAYRQIQPLRVSRVFILGPSHHVYLRRCALSSAASYETPLGNLDIDISTCNELMKTGAFQTMSLDIDEAEHSIEMQLPYLRHVFQGKDVKLIPILVGSLTADSEAMYGKLFSPYFRAPDSLFVISSDFCHWGSRFSYTFYDSDQGPIHRSIQWLDHLGMEIIAKGNAQDFHAYLRKYGNTICGRHPIGILLNILQTLDGLYRTEFLRYSQSSECESMQDSSVSYTAGAVYSIRPSATLEQM